MSSPTTTDDSAVVKKLSTPLIEVPVLVALVYVSLALRGRFTSHTPAALEVAK